MEVGRISLAPGARKTPTASDDGGVGYKKRTLFQLGGHPSHSWFHARLCTNFSPCTYIQDDDGGEDEHEFIFCRGFFFQQTNTRKVCCFCFCARFSAAFYLKSRNVFPRERTLIGGIPRNYFYFFFFLLRTLSRAVTKPGMFRMLPGST